MMEVESNRNGIRSNSIVEAFSGATSKQQYSVPNLGKPLLLEDKDLKSEGSQERWKAQEQSECFCVGEEWKGGPRMNHKLALLMDQRPLEAFSQQDKRIEKFIRKLKAVTRGDTCVSIDQ
ncbi:hypothetical protein TURU_125742 [Turdus rufiventris]|nr:hypothetical protein TURU_125742 [Turdus rufiventris]